MRRRFITKCDEGLLQNATKVYYKMRRRFITKCDEGLLQIATKVYYKMRRRFITKCDEGLLQNATKVYYKMRRRFITNCDEGLLQIAIVQEATILLQIVTVVTKCDIIIYCDSTWFSLCLWTCFFWLAGF